MVDEVIGLTSQKTRYANVKIETELSEDLPRIQASPSEIQQVLLNLVNNAIDSIDRPGGTVKVVTRSEGENVVLEIRDTGSGIPEANLARIFDPYYDDDDDMMRQEWELRYPELMKKFTFEQYGEYCEIDDRFYIAALYRNIIDNQDKLGEMYYNWVKREIDENFGDLTIIIKEEVSSPYTPLYPGGWQPTAEDGWQPKK